MEKYFQKFKVMFSTKTEVWFTKETFDIKFLVWVSQFSILSILFPFGSKRPQGTENAMIYGITYLG